MQLVPQLYQALLAGSQDPARQVAVVTPRRRLARNISQAFHSENQASAGYHPRVSTIADWIIKEASPLLLPERRQLINSAQAALLWEEALRQTAVPLSQQVEVFSDAGQGFRQELVAQAQDAWRKLHLYKIEKKRGNFAGDKITRFFYDWLLAYTNLCTERRLCDEFMLAELLRGALLRQEAELRPSLWVGFANIYPIYEEIYQLAAKNNPAGIARLERAFITEEQDREEIKIKRYENQQDELRQLARQVKRRHEQDAAKLIGVVIPGMENNWHEIYQVFAQAFGLEARAESKARALERPRQPFDMSWGEELRGYPLIADLLRLLQLSQNRVPPAALLDYFNSPYLRGHAREADARAQLDDKLAALSARTGAISVEDLSKARNLASIKAASSAALFLGAPLLQESLRRYFAVPRAFVREASPRHWAQVFSRQAEALGWGELEWSTEERQLWDKWLALMDELFCAGSVIAEMSRRQALDFLAKGAAQIFQPSPPATQIRILGLQEAEGLQFDCLFACHMNSGCLPQPRNNLFIPFELAKICGLVGGDSYIKHQQATIDGLLAAAPELHLSFAALVDDEEKQCHPLLAHLPPEETAAELRQLPPPKFGFEKLADAAAPPVTDAERLRQLVGMVKSHSSCPFQSFIAHRVRPHRIDPPPQELSPIERGNIFHEAMHKFWREVGSREKLETLTAEQTDALLQQAVADALDANDAVFLADEMICQLEQRLLTELAAKLLELERGRARDFTVAELEQEAKITLGGREFALKIDRIDSVELSGGASSQVLIDYKLGNKLYTEYDMQGERPLEPQLLIYSLAVENLNSLGFMSINYKRQAKAAGFYLEEDGLFSGGRGRRGQLDRGALEERRQTVRDLYDSFLAGNSAVDPRNSGSCQFCDFSAICRIGEAGALRTAEDV